MNKKQLNYMTAKLTITLNDAANLADGILTLIEDRKIRNEKAEAYMDMVSDRIRDLIVLVDNARGELNGE